MKAPEILAPAGSMDALKAALRSGADAVYIGGKSFSARSSAANFSSEELAEASALCHLYGAKLYITVNTIISDDEAADFCDFINLTASLGVDAYIVQDWGCAELIRRCVPDAVLHASTQMSVHTAAGAEMLKELGYSRVVPARELDRNVLSDICSKDIETEVFVHGALCMSVSGQCYMSALIGSRSANRGCCGQACRLPFTADNNRYAAALSLKDLSLLPCASELADTGVDSFKIEGRMKRPEYVASAVNELQRSLSGDAPAMDMLRGVFSRGGFTDGYFTGNRSDMFGVREKDDVTAARVILPKLHELYRFERKLYPVDFHAFVHKGSPVRVTASLGDISVNAEAAPPEKAMKHPTDLAVIEKHLSKLGDTVFICNSVTADIEDGLIVHAGCLNELRRQLAESLKNAVTQRNTPSYTITGYIPSLPEGRTRDSLPDKLPLRTLCRTASQLTEALRSPGDVIISTELAEKVPEADMKRVIISPPRFISDEKKTVSRLSELRSRGFERLFCHTPDTIAIGRKLGFRMHGSFSLNIFNSFSAEAMMKLGLEDFVVSFEAKLSQISQLHSPIPFGVVTAGRLPLMLTRNCPIKNQVGCQKCRHILTDRTKRVFPVACSGEYVEILNSDTLYIPEIDGRHADFGVVLLNDEDKEQTHAMLSGMRPEGSITKGLYHRGII